MKEYIQEYASKKKIIILALPDSPKLTYKWQEALLDILKALMQRKKPSGQSPWFVNIGSYGRFAIPGFSSLLCQGRGLGIALICGINSLQELITNVGEDEALQTINNTKTKILSNGLNHEEKASYIVFSRGELISATSNPIKFETEQPLPPYRRNRFLRITIDEEQIRKELCKTV